MISAAFGSDDLDLSWQSTPALWMAYRKGQCFCEECRYKAVVGTGKTQDEAVADFNEKASEMDDEDEDTRDMVELDTLPEDHPMRNTVLGEMGAEYRGVRGGNWHPVEPGHGLGLNTFNMLDGSHWDTFCKWRAPRKAA